MSVEHALTAALDREHEAVYGYGVTGAHLSGRAVELALAYRDEHRRARDELEALLRARGTTPAPPEPGYALPLRVTDSRTARDLAVRLERAAAGGYAELVAAARGRLRRSAAAQLQACAVRQAAWSGRVDPLPGLRR